MRVVPPPLPGPTECHGDRRAYERLVFSFRVQFNRLKRLYLLLTVQEFLFYYQRDPAQERLPSGGG